MNRISTRVSAQLWCSFVSTLALLSACTDPGGQETFEQTQAAWYGDGHDERHHHPHYGPRRAFCADPGESEPDPANVTFGPASFTREQAKPAWQTRQFDRPACKKGPFKLVVKASQGARGIIKHRGKTLLEPDDFEKFGRPLRCHSSKTLRVERTITLADTNELAVKVLGGAEAELQISVVASGAVETPECLTNPLDQPLPPDALSVIGADPFTFNAAAGSIELALSGGSFSPFPEDTSVLVNGSPLPPEAVTLNAGSILLSSVLGEPSTQISIVSSDELGRPLYFDETFWAGSSTLHVNLVDPAGQPIVAPVHLVAKLSDDPKVGVDLIDVIQSGDFVNVPARTILLEATAPGLHGALGVLGFQGSATLTLYPFGTPSPVDNNDFALGTDGWEIGNAPVHIAAHDEGPAIGQASFIASATAGAVGTPGAAKASGRLVPPLMPVASPGGSAALAAASSVSSLAAGSIVDNDLVLVTSGPGEQNISRTFATGAGTTGVRIRYRFITAEVPGGYFGSVYNDNYRVTLRSQQAGGVQTESQSMNGLGLAAFDYGRGTTAWREITLPVSSQGDTIQVEAAVANVGDGAYDSQVVIDFVEEIKDQIAPKLAWNEQVGGLDLTYEVKQQALTQAATIEVYFARAAQYSARLGSAVFAYPVPAGTAPGQYGPVHIPGASLSDDPATTTQLLAAASPTNAFSLPDVHVGYTGGANPAHVKAAMLDIVKDGLRAAGEPSAFITSTARTPEQQAAAMFSNLVNPAHPVSVNVTNQLNLYGPNGDAVIQVFVAQTAGLTLQQINQNRASIRAAMVTEIYNRGPSNVSKHCADPNLVTVVDVGAAGMSSNGGLFVAATQGRVTQFLDERTTNGCFHLQL